MSDANVALARRWFEEVWNQRRGDTIDELLTPESVCHSPAGVLEGPEGFRSNIHGPFLRAFSDIDAQVEDVIAQGDTVVVRWHTTVTHTGHGLGFPPSGRQVSVRGMTWFRFEAGKMMEGWDCWNLDGFLKALGAPAPDQVA